MYYVYILSSLKKDWTYVGYTSNLKQRLKAHKEGKSAATRNYRPFVLESYVMVKDKEKAIQLEKYFKTGSGIAWMKKRLLQRN
jgi:putative endonuclease